MITLIYHFRTIPDFKEVNGLIWNNLLSILAKRYSIIYIYTLFLKKISVALSAKRSAYLPGWRNW